ncbi:MAG TPA: hypothetical protein VFE90_07075 [Myxococcales bacterium]|jgi:hypothetical protein|nr:hypothetical protein [Myxococcales bacterium]
MGLFARFWHYSIDTYGGAPVLLLITTVQIALLGWVAAEAIRARRERNDPRLSAEARRVRAAHRAELWQKRVRPLALTMMLLGPGIGLGMSTLLGALGMGALGDVMGSQASADALATTMAHAYREISYAYFLMVGGTFPMLLGPVVVLVARRLDEEGDEARGGEPDELVLHTLKSLLAVAEQQAARAHIDAARTHALLEQALQRRAAA